LFPEQESVEAIRNVAPSSVDALMMMFTLSVLEGDTPKKRFDAIREATKSGRYKYMNGDFSDSGFQEQYQEGGDQVSHFIQGAVMGYKTKEGTFREFAALSTICGHEMIGDISGGRFGVNYHTYAGNARQILWGLQNSGEANEWFLEGTDEAFQKIYDLNDDPDANRTGNSVADLRLSYIGWIFGRKLANGEFETMDDAVRWLEDNIADPNR
jgi:hypothetical protein